MRDSNLEATLRNWFKNMVNRYRWLSIKFEYNEKRGVYLVSYAPISEISANDDFISESMAFEDKMNALYGDNAPLFCDEEKYFKMSVNAEVFEYINFQLFKIYGQLVEWLGNY
jgi:hypothetical protein